ncbi:hypothetical protein K7640_20445 [Micromonospora sp. PLK6-60]|uniref:hypothetical protein n=1 Tax=Micromonospora sp. PLK6-60 TaxID=2873383 RepID=UPI001CA728DF|nr:hypothetical protein [Micromonospora sp. PLK6-60]MBY8874202.1 hypothetical protein [Micromonospora sp. PLK6-60]
MSAEHGDRVGLSADARDQARIYQAGRDLYVNHAAPARSGYLQQVRRLAPELLRDRDAELAELAAFCTAPDGPAYAWWRAGPWAGKSALMSWFVLHPPPGVRVVSFFVTARFAGSSDRGAFLDNLSVQLAELLGEPAPTGLPEAVREGYLLDLLDRAARWCAEHGERLVLLVDGLDEDRGVCAGPDAHSIAALLPHRPGHGLRVLVAGRPNPPIPTDVPHRHPLRDPAVVRTLAVSPHAQAVRNDANTELRRLLDGTDLQRDLLGLLTAAVGGLSGADLAELTGADQWQVEEHLHTVSGRTFLTYPSRWQPAHGPQSYLLGHEELQQSARHYLGPARLAGYRRRLHDWADGYRRRGWPEGTPEYLLRGWFRLLRDTGEVDRMVACGTDQARHDRMLDLSGGDLPALEEIRAAQDALLGRDEPDLTAMARLAVHAHQLGQRSAQIPTELPAVWVALGHPARADALARSLDDGDRRHPALNDEDRRTTAVILMMLAYLRGGDADGAEAAALAVADEQGRSQVLWRLVHELVDAGRLDRAAALADAIPAAGERADGFASVAEARRRSGDPTGALDATARAEQAASRIADPGQQARALARLAGLVRGQGDAARAGELAGRAEAAADRVATADERVGTLMHLAARWQESGDVERARRVAGRGTATALATTGTERRMTDVPALVGALLALGEDRQMVAVVRFAAATGDGFEVARVVTVLARGGDLSRATAVAEWLGDSMTVPAYTALAEAADAAGDAAGAREWLGRATARLRSAWRGPSSNDTAVVARETARQGDPARATALVEEIVEPDRRAETLCLLAREAVEAGRPDDARDLVARASTAASKVVDSYSHPAARDRARAGVVAALVATGDLDSAASAARGIRTPDVRAGALARVATGLVHAGDLPAARRFALLAEAAYRSAGGWNEATVAREARLTGLAVSDGIEAARVGAEAIGDPEARAWALHGLAQWLTSTTGAPPDPRLIEQARAAGRAVHDEDRRDRVLRALSLLTQNHSPPTRPTVEAGHIWLPGLQLLSERVEQLLADGDRAGAQRSVRRAEQSARDISDPFGRRTAIGSLARLHARAGDVDRAEALLHEIVNPDQRETALTATALIVAAAGDPDGAEGLIRRGLEPAGQDRALATLAQAVATTSPPGHAEALAHSIADGGRRDDALRAVARVLAGAGQLDRAEAVAGTIVGWINQAVALVDIAEQADSPRARRLLASVLRVGTWMMLRRLLPRIDPAACLAIADEYFRLNPDPATPDDPAG